MKTNDVDQKLNHLKTAIFQLKEGEALFNKYSVGLEEDYLAEYTADEILRDLLMCDVLSCESQYAIQVRLNTERKNMWQIKLLKFGDTVSLSRGLPILENFGVKLYDERPYEINIDNGNTIFICDFGVEVPLEIIDKIKDKHLLAKLEQAIVAVFDRKAENDSLNRLVLFSDLAIREIEMMRAITHYIVQTTLPFSKAYLADTLSSYPVVAHNLFAYFDARFNIETHDVARSKQIREEIVNILEKAGSLDADRILKAYLSVIDAMLRTNYYQLNNNMHKSYISFKLESAQISFLPKPLPLYEIFVYSMRFEAIHLRGGKVARGGLRWSDRREDFRTEVLGLVKAQIVKNSVIIPTGSKGGFVCKKLPEISNRDAYMQEGINCYKNFISGLLDITDNLVSGVIVPPKDVVRYDMDDPYLVVAADKGTATFSDYANNVSNQYEFWLGDAFASGGTAGYDHKKMGITAKGAWESAKRHFRFLGINIQTQVFTAIGIGDMAGDVFGNGMLLSKHIKLLAAFNHQHIFIDPNPNVATSYAERERLFNLPRSSWADYDKSLISPGGGVFERSAKSVTLSKEVKKWLGINVSQMTPTELIHCILQAPADMLYNGGIGTYIKAESESDEIVKDKANDGVRVNGKELKVKVVIEGGNLGATQLGRIEYAKTGGLIWTDAIDNSAGVDCSDHEVNIKILFAAIMQQTNMTVEERNTILATMTDEVASLVLRDNYLQTEILSYATVRADELFSINMNFVEKLEKRGDLDRGVEYLPGYTEITDRQKAGIGLTRPELAVLLAYSKIVLDRDILNSELVNDPVFDELLLGYFPKLLQTNYAQYIHTHYLRQEIIANQLANLMVNRVGITFVLRFQDEFRTDVSHIARAFWTVYKIIDAEKIFASIEGLDNKIHAKVQIELLIRLKKALERMIRWVLRRYKDENNVFSKLIGYKPEVTHLLGILPEIVRSKDYPDVAKLEKDLINASVPPELITFISRSSHVPQVLDIIIHTHDSKHNLEAVARNYFYIGRELGIDWLRKNLIALPENNKWQALSRSALLSDGYLVYSSLLKTALDSTDGNDEKFAKTWMKKEAVKIALVKEMFDELKTYKTLDLAMLSAVVRELANILLN
ncbi:MAG: gdhA [Burkholderiales bacterium]|jgi:glutamate dehydrogenase|nr:gdhA [Burkholderiales bacterium]